MWILAPRQKFPVVRRGREQIRTCFELSYVAVDRMEKILKIAVAKGGVQPTGFFFCMCY